MGIIGTVLLIGNYIGMKNIQQIFWTLFALASILLLAPYLLMFPAVIKLRRDAPDVPRPYRIPGGKIGLWISVILGEFFILLACVFFFVPPKNTTNVLRYELSLIIGIVSTVAIGILIYVRNKKTKN
jgi:amino acid transporter